MPPALRLDHNQPTLFRVYRVLKKVAADRDKHRFSLPCSRLVSARSRAGHSRCWIRHSGNLLHPDPASPLAALWIQFGGSLASARLARIDHILPAPVETLAS